MVVEHRLHEVLCAQSPDGKRHSRISLDRKRCARNVLTANDVRAGYKVLYIVTLVLAAPDIYIYNEHSACFCPQEHFNILK